MVVLLVTCGRWSALTAPISVSHHHYALTTPHREGLVRQENARKTPPLHTPDTPPLTHTTPRTILCLSDAHVARRIRVEPTVLQVPSTP